MTIARVTELRGEALELAAMRHVSSLERAGVKESGVLLSGCLFDDITRELPSAYAIVHVRHRQRRQRSEWRELVIQLCGGGE